MRTLQLQFSFMEEVEPRPTPSNDNLPSDENQAPGQPAKPLSDSVAPPCPSYLRYFMNE